MTVAAPGIDAEIPWHFGDPLREQRALATRAGVVDRSNRDILQVGGPERLPWLHSICSQYVSNLADGDTTEALVLSPNGHVEQLWQVAELGGTVDAPPQYWRSQPSTQKALFGATTFGTTFTLFP